MPLSTPKLLLWDRSASPNLDVRPPWNLKFWASDGVVRRFFNESCVEEFGSTQPFPDNTFIASLLSQDDTIVSWSSDADWLVISDAGSREATVTIDASALSPGDYVGNIDAIGTRSGPYRIPIQTGVVDVDNLVVSPTTVSCELGPVHPPHFEEEVTLFGLADDSSVLRLYLANAIDVSLATSFPDAAISTAIEFTPPGNTWLQCRPQSFLGDQSINLDVNIVTGYIDLPEIVVGGLVIRPHKHYALTMPPGEYSAVITISSPFFTSKTVTVTMTITSL